MRRRAIFAAAAAAAGGGLGVGLGAGAGPRPARAATRAGDRIPDVEVVTHEGRRARFRSDLVDGKVVLVNAMFAGCGGTCPLVTANLLRVQELLGDRVGRDLFIYSFTLLPELETPEILADYAKAHGVGPGWLFLTGAKDDMERLRRGLGFTSSDPELDVLADTHTGMLRYGSQALDRWAATPALSRPEWIVKAVTTALPVA